MKSKLTKEEQENLARTIRIMASQSPNTPRAHLFKEALQQCGVLDKIGDSSSNVANWWRKAFPEWIPETQIKASPMDIIRAAEQQIKKAITELDEERNKLQQRIIELDNLIAKYRKIT